MPGTPNRLPPTMMENSTHTPDTPMLLPTIRGAMILPSNCWMQTIRIMNSTALMGLERSRSTTPGMAPMMGPK